MDALQELQYLETAQASAEPLNIAEAVAWLQRRRRLIHVTPAILRQNDTFIQPIRHQAGSKSLRFYDQAALERASLVCWLRMAGFPTSRIKRFFALREHLSKRFGELFRKISAWPKTFPYLRKYSLLHDEVDLFDQKTLGAFIEWKKDASVSREEKKRLQDELSELRELWGEVKERLRTLHLSIVHGWIASDKEWWECIGYEIELDEVKAR